MSLEQRKKYTKPDLEGVPGEERLDGMLASEGENVPHASMATPQGRSNAEGSLKERNRTHTKEKPFQCETCSYSASRKSQLSLHVRVHTGERPFKCNMCSYSSSYNSHLTRHTRTHTGEKPFKCKFCSASFTTCTALTNHMMTHTREKPFKCELCSYASPRKSGLVRHMMTHTGKRPFKCGICSKAFSQRWSLENHNLRTHTSKIPFKCEGCSHMFATCEEARNNTATQQTNTCKHIPLTPKRAPVVPSNSTAGVPKAVQASSMILAEAETEADISFPHASTAHCQIELFSPGGGALSNVHEGIPLQLGTPSPRTENTDEVGHLRSNFSGKSSAGTEGSSLPSTIEGSRIQVTLLTPPRRTEESSVGQSVRRNTSSSSLASSLPSVMVGSMMEHWLPTSVRRHDYSSGSQSRRRIGSSTLSLRTNESSLPSTIGRSGNQTFWNNLIPTPPGRPGATFIEAEDLPTNDEILELEPPRPTSEYDIDV